MEELLELKRNQIATFKKGKKNYHVYRTTVEDYILITEENMQVFSFDDIVEIIEEDNLVFENYNNYKDFMGVV